MAYRRRESGEEGLELRFERIGDEKEEDSVVIVPGYSVSQYLVFIFQNRLIVIWKDSAWLAVWGTIWPIWMWIFLLYLGNLFFLVILDLSLDRLSAFAPP